MNNLIATKLEEILSYVDGKRTARLSRGNVRMQRNILSKDGDLDKAKQKHIQRMSVLNEKYSN